MGYGRRLLQELESELVLLTRRVSDRTGGFGFCLLWSKWTGQTWVVLDVDASGLSQVQSREMFSTTPHWEQNVKLGVLHSCRRCSGYPHLQLRSLSTRRTTSRKPVVSMLCILGVEVDGERYVGRRGRFFCLMNSIYSRRMQRWDLDGVRNLYVFLNFGRCCIVKRY